MTRHNSIEKRKSNLLKNRNEEIRKAYLDITLSINYASKIQNSIFVRKEVLTYCVKDAVIFNKSKEVVNRNFCWFSKQSNRTTI